MCPTGVTSENSRHLCMAASHARHLEAPPPNVGADRTRGVTVLPRTTRGSNMMFIGGIDWSAFATRELISFARPTAGKRTPPKACCACQPVGDRRCIDSAAFVIRMLHPAWVVCGVIKSPSVNYADRGHFDGTPHPRRVVRRTVVNCRRWRCRRSQARTGADP